MTKENSRNRQMLEAARKLAKDYLLEDINNYETIIEAVSEMLMEDFEVKEVVCKNLANKLIDLIWNDLVAEVKAELDDAADWYREREEARMGAY